MHLLYVDESGDTGRSNPENHTFVLCGLLVHHADWHVVQAGFKAMRARIREHFGLQMHAELHASELLGRSPILFGLNRAERIKVALHQVEMLRRQKGLFAIRITIEKQTYEGDLLAAAWASMLEKARSNIICSEHDRCSAQGLIVICDDHRTAPAAGWLDTVTKDLDLETLILDQPFGRDSAASDFLQACDVLAYLSKQRTEPNKYFRGNNSRSLIERCERLFREKGQTFKLQGKGGACAPPDRNLGGS
jgi:hypothetical protein